MSKGPHITKMNIALNKYVKVKGFNHTLLKLAEECNELSQAIIKHINTQDDPKCILEEMAHTFLFTKAVFNNWDIGDKLLFYNNINERLTRIINKVMPNKKYPARLRLTDSDSFQSQFGPLDKEPTLKVIGNYVYSYLTPGEYSDQLMSPDDRWRCPISGAVGEFDDGYYESEEDL